MELNGVVHGYQRLHPHPTAGPRMQMHPPEYSTTTTECLVREQDRFMPIANVIRIMRKTLPTHAKISDDAKETIQECVSEFISFVTGEANDRCQREQRKTITAEDILWAMSKLGFDDYIEPLTIYLHRYRELDGGERGSMRGGDPSLMKRSGVGNIDDFAPVFRMGSQLVGPPPPPVPPAATVAGFLNDAAIAGGGGGVGTSRRATGVAGFQPYVRFKE
ncbi:hypothetical protein LXL04_026979 [Taraxacum kok-saghyz]